MYGTLRKEIATSIYYYVLARHCEYFSAGHIQGRLYEVDGYPGAVESNNAHDKVQGEIYEMVSGKSVLPQLDEYEECTESHPRPHEYVRKKLSVALTSGGSVSAWVYLFNHDISGLTQIKTGDYWHFLKENDKKTSNDACNPRSGAVKHQLPVQSS